MKFNYLVKATPLLSTLLIIIMLCISNQRQDTKLKILIWNTPSLSLGTYLALSVGTGFIISYVTTSRVAKFGQTNKINRLRFKENNEDQKNNENIESPTHKSYANTLIERDINDPSPTINANFRIIGRPRSKKINYINNEHYNDNEKYYDSNYFEENNDEIAYQNDTNSNVNSISNDWHDESYSNW